MKYALYILFIYLFPLTAGAAPPPPGMTCVRQLLEHLPEEQYVRWSENLGPSDPHRGLYVLRFERPTAAEATRFEFVLRQHSDLTLFDDWTVRTPDSLHLFVRVDRLTDASLYENLKAHFDGRRLSSANLIFLAEVKPVAPPIPSEQIPLGRVTFEEIGQISKPTLLRGRLAAESVVAMPGDWSLVSVMVLLKIVKPLKGFKISTSRALAPQVSAVAMRSKYYYGQVNGTMILSPATWEALRDLAEIELPPVLRTNPVLPKPLGETVEFFATDISLSDDRLRLSLLRRLHDLQHDPKSGPFATVFGSFPAPLAPGARSAAPKAKPDSPKPVPRPNVDVVEEVVVVDPPEPRPRGTKYFSLDRAREVLTMLAREFGASEITVHRQLALAAERLAPSVSRLEFERGLNATGLKKADAALIQSEQSTNVAVARLEAAWRWLERFTDLEPAREITSGRIDAVADRIAGRVLPPPKPRLKDVKNVAKDSRPPAAPAAPDAGFDGPPSLNVAMEDAGFTPVTDQPYTLRTNAGATFRVTFGRNVLKNLFQKPALRANYALPLLHALLRGIVPVEAVEGIKRSKSDKSEVVVENRKFGEGCFTGRIDGEALVVGDFVRKLARR